MNILVVDDNPMVAMILADHLRERGHSVKAAFEAEQAQRIFRQETYDLVVTDLVLPDFDGVTLLERLRKSDPDFDAVVISGFSELLAEKAARIRLLGAESVIEKPFAFADIDSAVRQVQRRRGGAAEPPGK